MRSLRTVVLAATATALLVVASPAHAAPVQLTATMTPDEEVPLKGPAGATGSATLDFKTDNNEVCYTFVTQNLTDPLTAGHIHKGAKGVAGDVLIDLQVTAGKLTGCVPSDAAKIQAVVANPQGHYVNLHTQAHPKGALRGQLLASITNPEAAAGTNPQAGAGTNAQAGAGTNLVEAAGSNPAAAAGTQSQAGAPALARTGAGSAGLLLAIGFGLVSAGAAARLARRRL